MLWLLTHRTADWAWQENLKDSKSLFCLDYDPVSHAAALSEHKTTHLHWLFLIPIRSSLHFIMFSPALLWVGQSLMHQPCEESRSICQRYKINQLWFVRRFLFLLPWAFYMRGRGKIFFLQMLKDVLGSPPSFEKCVVKIAWLWGQMGVRWNERDSAGVIPGMISALALLRWRYCLLWKEKPSGWHAMLLISQIEIFGQTVLQHCLFLDRQRWKLEHLPC